jgi:hypothetical protein
MANVKYNFPTSEQIRLLTSVESFVSDRLVATKLLPVDVDNFRQSPTAISWDILEPTRGLTTLSALDADPVLISQRGIQNRTARPLYFMNSISIPNSQLLNMRKLGQSEVRDATDSVLRAIDQLSRRTSALIEYANVQALTGVLSIDGVTVDYDFAASHKPVCGTTSGYGTVWTSTASAKPVEDIRRAAATLNGSGAAEIEIYASIEAINTMLATNEIQSLLDGVGSLRTLSPEGFALDAPAMLGNGISRIVVSNNYFTDESGTPAAFFPANKIFLVGRAPGVELGCFASTPSLANGGLDGARGGPFVYTTDHTNEPKPEILVTGGIYGLPVIYRPDMVCCLQISA